MAGAEPPKEEIARERAGSADEGNLNGRIDQAWSNALEDPRTKAEFAAALGVNERDLDPAHSPFRAEVSESGLHEAGILIYVASGFASGFLKDIAKDFASAAGKAAAEKLRTLWNDHMRDKVSPFGSGVLGPPHDDDDDDDD